MAKEKAGAPKRENRIVRYFKETRAELRKVTWPTRPETLRLSGIVLAVTIFMAALLGLLDFLFARFFALFI